MAHGVLMSAWMSQLNACAAARRPPCATSTALCAESARSSSTSAAAAMTFTATDASGVSSRSLSSSASLFCTTVHLLVGVALLGAPASLAAAGLGAS